MADRELKLVRAERAYFQEFYENHRKLLHYAASKYTSDPELLQDLMQDTLERLMRNTDTLRRMNPAKTASYLCTTVKSVYIDHCRKRSGTEQPLETPVLETLGARTDPMDYGAKWDTQILRSRMNQRDWFVLEARYIAGADDQEIADTLGVGADTVRPMLTRARRRAKAVLADNKERGNQHA